MTVYLIQAPKPKKGWVPDFSKASEYGRIETIFDMDEKVFATPQRSLTKAVLKLKNNFVQEQDYILWPNLGDPTALQCVCFALSKCGFEKARFLYWNRKRNPEQDYIDDGFYTPLEFNLEKINE